MKLVNYGNKANYRYLILFVCMRKYKTLNIVVKEPLNRERRINGRESLLSRRPIKRRPLCLFCY